MKRILFALCVCLLLCAGVRAEAVDGLRFSEGFIAEKGLVTVYWSDDANAAPYTLYYQCAEDTLDDQAVFVEDGIEQTQCTLRFLAPGCEYMLWVENSQGDSAETLIRLPEPGTFEDGKLSAQHIHLRALPCCQPVGENSKKSLLLKSADMTEHIKDTFYGVRLELSMPELARDRIYETQFVFRAPGGYTRVYSMGDVTYGRYAVSTLCMYWPLVGSEFFSDLYDQMKTIPVGQYAVTCYLDGMTAAYAAFSVY